MRILALACALLCSSMALANERITQNGMTYEFRSSAISNLFYQLDCMAEDNHCSAAAFRNLWKAQLGWNDEDQKQFEQWRKLYQDFDHEIHIASPELDSLPLRSGFRGLDLTRRRQMAAFASASLEDLSRNLNLVMDAPTQAKTEKIIRHFLPRFEKWWKASAGMETEAFLKKAPKYMQAKGLFATLARFRAFYSPTLPEGQVLYFNFILRPELKDFKGSSGTQVENVSVIEVQKGEPVEERIHVILHELCHYLYGEIAPAEFAGLLKGFISSSDDSAIFALNLLNESLATVLGNGIVYRETHDAAAMTRYLAKEKSFYNDSSIDRVAKALLPVLDRRLAKGESLLAPSFVPEYLQTVNKALGDDRHSLANVLRNRAIICASSAQKDSERALGKMLVANSIWTSQGLEDQRSLDQLADYPLASGVLMLLQEDIPKLKSWREILGADIVRDVRSASNKRAFVYGIRRTPKSYIFLLVAKDQSAMSELVEKFASVKQPFEKVGVSL